MAHSGSIQSRARKAGQSTQQYVAGNISADGPVGKLARLAYFRQATHGDGKSSMAHAGDNRTMKTRLYQVG